MLPTELQTPQAGVPASIEERVKALVAKIQATKITSPESRTIAISDLADAKALKRETEKQMEQAVRPFLDGERKARAPFKLLVGMLEPWITHVTTALRTWDQAELNRVRLEQQRENERIAEENRKRIEKAEAKGVTPVLKAPAVFAAPPKTEKLDDGKSVTRKTATKWRIPGVGPDEDVEKLKGDDPRVETLERRCLKLDVTRINQLVKAGERPVGIEVFEEIDYSGRG